MTVQAAPTLVVIFDDEVRTAALAGAEDDSALLVMAGKREMGVKP